jgi:uncharacterized protein YbcI
VSLQTARSPSAEISNHVVRVMAEYTGRGPQRARTYINENLVTVLLEDVLTKGEQKLLEAGQLGQVEDMRLTFQKVMRDDLVRGVEEVLSRKVYAFFSGNDLEASMLVESFVLHPNGPGPAGAG